MLKKIHDFKLAIRSLVMITSIAFGKWTWAIEIKNELGGSTPKAIYGLDERSLVTDIADEDIKDLARSVSAQFPNYSVFSETDKHLLIKNRTLSEAHQVCPDVAFANSSSLSQCSGFLVGSDLLLTAGHCVKDKNDCENVFFSFDYKNGDYQKEYLTLAKENVYRCKQVVQSNYGIFSRTDFALIKLDRPVLNRKPLKIRRLGAVDSKDQLFVLGHPMGLPLMYQPGGKVRSNIGINTFVTNLDTFSGNSGSPVFNKETNVVEGILVKGEDDLEYDVEYGCYKNKVCRENECRGETVLRTSALPLLKIPLLK